MWDNLFLVSTTKKVCHIGRPFFFFFQEYIPILCFLHIEKSIFMRSWCATKIKPMKFAMGCGWSLVFSNIKREVGSLWGSLQERSRIFVVSGKTEDFQGIPLFCWTISCLKLQVIDQTNYSKNWSFPNCSNVFCMFCRTYKYQAGKKKKVEILVQGLIHWVECALSVTLSISSIRKIKLKLKDGGGLWVCFLSCSYEKRWATKPGTANSSVSCY